MLLRMANFRKHVLRLGNTGRCNPPKGSHDGLAGRDDDGSFKTSRCKVYPAEMNRTLAQSIVQFAQRFFAGCTVATELPVPLRPYQDAAFAQPDLVQQDCYPEAAAT